MASAVRAHGDGGGADAVRAVFARAMAAIVRQFACDGTDERDIGDAHARAALLSMRRAFAGDDGGAVLDAARGGEASDAEDAAVRGFVADERVANDAVYRAPSKGLEIVLDACSRCETMSVAGEIGVLGLALHAMDEDVDGGRLWARGVAACNRSLRRLTGERLASDRTLERYYRGVLARLDEFRLCYRDSLRLAFARVCGARQTETRETCWVLLKLASFEKVPVVRAALVSAIDALGGPHEDTAVEFSRMFFNASEKSSIVRKRALEAVRRLRGPKHKWLVEKVACKRALELGKNDPELRQITCEALQRLWEGREGDPATDGSDDVRLYMTVEFVGALTTDADADVRAAATRCLGHLRAAAAAKVKLIHARVEDVDEGVRDAAAEALIALGFVNASTGTFKARGNYKPSKFSANKNFFAALTGDVENISTSRVKIPIGAIVRVWWELDEEYYEAKVKAYDKATRMYTIVYIEDGVEEVMNFRKEKVDLKHKLGKKRATWIPCGMMPRQKKQKSADNATETRGRASRHVERPIREDLPGDWRNYIAELHRDKSDCQVGGRVRVYWPLDKAWYVGQIRAHVAGTDKYSVHYYEDDCEEELDFAKEKVQVYILNPDVRPPSVRGIEPMRLEVYTGPEDKRTSGWFEPGMPRGYECVSYVNEEGTKVTARATQFCTYFNPDIDKGSRWRREIYIKADGVDGLDDDASLNDWFKIQGERWSYAVVGQTFEINTNVDMRDFRDDDDTKDRDPVWQLVKIVDYNNPTGEHQVVNVDADGKPDRDQAMWVPLFTQHTR